MSADFLAVVVLLGGGLGGTLLVAWLIDRRSRRESAFPHGSLADLRKRLMDREGEDRGRT